jgi:hypothetical protein
VLIFVVVFGLFIIFMGFLFVKRCLDEGLVVLRTVVALRQAALRVTVVHSVVENFDDDVEFLRLDVES